MCFYPAMGQGASEPAGKRCVFVSYARADRAHATRVAEGLAAAGFDLWWDALIDGGAAFARTIEDQLDRADAVVVLWSHAAAASDWVRDEAGRARELGKLVPISIDGASPPIGFRQYHAINFAHWSGGATAPEMVALTRAIQAVRGEAPVPHAETPRTASVSRRNLLVAGGSGALLLAGGGAAWHFLGRTERPARSIAVLPFKNLSGDPAQAYFSDGLSEEVRAMLSRNAQLRVAAPTSSAKARAEGDDAPAIARKLGVAYLLEGSVQRARDVVRITADLIDATTGFSRWSHSYDRTMTDIFAVQTEIAGIVAAELVARVVAEPSRPGGTRDVAAYDAFLRGRTLFNADVDEASDRAALAQFDEAIGIDPSYAAAHAARSRLLAAIASAYAKGSEMRALYDAAITAARRAIALAPDLAEAQLALGYALYTGKLAVAEARAPFARAYKLGAGDADLCIPFAYYAARSGQAPEAVQAINRAMSLDRLNPRAFRAAGTIRYGMRGYAEAIPLSQRALALAPTLGNARANIGNCLLMLGRFADARAAYEREPQPVGRLTGLAVVTRRLGDAAGARAAFGRLVAELGDSALYQQAQVQAQWGERDAAFAALAAARKAGDAGLLIAGVDPMLDPLRGDPRFGPVLKMLDIK